MRLHQVLQALKPHAGKDPLVDRLMGVYPHMHHFDFGSIDPVPDDEWKGLQLYSFDLLENDLLDVPYEAFSFAWSQTLPTGAAVDRIAACMKVPGEMAGHPDMPAAAIECWLFSSAMHEGARAYHCMHTVFNLVLSKASGKLRVFAPELMPMKPDGSRHQPDENEMNLAPNLIDDAMALVALLHAEGVTTKTTQAPARLNKARAAKGKIAIGPLSQVFINVGSKRVAPSGFTVGSHASPRMHWRRGHIRRLPSGKITNVRPALVGSVGTATPRDYKVKVA